MADELMHADTGGADGELRMPEAPIGVDTQEKLTEWIAAIPRRQTRSSQAIEFDGDIPTEHREIIIQCPFRRSDANEREGARRAAVGIVAWEIFYEISSRPGALYWRIMPEFEVTEVRPVFIRHSVIEDEVSRLKECLRDAATRDPGNGPDCDYVTDLRGWADHRYGLVRAYTRLSVHFTS